MDGLGLQWAEHHSGESRRCGISTEKRCLWSGLKPLTLGPFQCWVSMMLMTCFPHLAPWLLTSELWLSHLHLSACGVYWCPQGLYGPDHIAKLPAQDMWVLERRISARVMFLVSSQVINNPERALFAWVLAVMTTWPGLVAGWWDHTKMTNLCLEAACPTET